MNISVDESIADPTALVVRAAVVPTGTTPVEANWKAASWLGTLNNRRIRVLMGPGSDVGALTVGVTYRMWAEITGSPEKPTVVSENRIEVF